MVCKVWVALVSIFLHEKLVSKLQEHHLVAYGEVYMEDCISIICKCWQADGDLSLLSGPVLVVNLW